MEDDRSDLLLFIDLGFILLVGFLILTETTPEAEVPLPSESQEESDPVPLYEVRFDDRMQFLVLRLPQQTAACVPETLAHLAGCLEQAYRQDAERFSCFLRKAKLPSSSWYPCSTCVPGAVGNAPSIISFLLFHGIALV